MFQLFDLIKLILFKDNHLLHMQLKLRIVSAHIYYLEYFSNMFNLLYGGVCINNQKKNVVCYVLSETQERLKVLSITVLYVY